MKKYLLAGTFALAFVPPAAAEVHTSCVLQQPNGTQLVYRFEVVGPNLMAEVSFEKNGTITASPTGKRPPWTFAESGGVVAIESVRDPVWRIFVNNDMEASGDVIRADAVLMKGQKLIAKGGCGWPRKDRPAARPARPEWGV